MKDNWQDKPLDGHGCQLVAAFYHHVRKTPSKQAVISHALCLNYEQLNRQSNRVAHTLRQQGVGPNTVVAICLERDVDMMVAIFAVLKAGGAYLPMAANYPAARKQAIIASSGTNVMITSLALSKVMTEAFEFHGQRLLIDQPSDWAEDASDLQVNVSPEDLAYVIYTSGSTGKPKGVAVERGALINRLQWMQQVYPITPDDVLFQKTVFSFDVSVWEIFWWALQGASVVLLPPDKEHDPRLQLRLIEQHQISVMHFVPSVLRLFIDYLAIKKNPALTDSLKYVFASGEVLKADDVNQFYRLFNRSSNAQLINLYGPTEAAIDVSHQLCARHSNHQQVSIGTAISGIGLYVLDNEFNQVADGIQGELYIGGVGLARGYYNDQSLTEQSFAVFNLAIGERLYKTGDLVVKDPQSGVFGYIGRADFQVKIRGVRIELGDIENQLNTMDQVNRTVVIADTDDFGNQYLYAFITVAQPLTLGIVRSYLATKLPDYMLPSRYFALKQIPLSENGKVDRKALLKLAIDGQTAAQYELTFAGDVQSHRQANFDLTSAQLGMWFSQQVTEQGAAFNSPSAIKISGAVNTDALSQACAFIVNRHELLRATLTTVEGTPQFVPNSVNPVLVIEALDTGTVDLTHCLNARASLPFILSEGEPLVRFNLLTLEKDQAVLLINLHHIISDGWSKGILIKELLRVYTDVVGDKTPVLPALKRQYSAYVAQQKDYFRSEDYQHGLDYWRDSLDGRLSKLDLPVDFSPASGQSFSGSFEVFEFDRQLSEQLTLLARQQKTSLFVLLLAIFKTHLGRLGQQQDITVGVPMAARPGRDFQGTVGLFVNVLPVSAQVKADIPFATFLDATNTCTLLAMKHQSVPLEMIVRAANPYRGQGLSTLYQAMFQLDSRVLSTDAVTGLTLEPMPLDIGVSQVPISLSMSEEGGIIKGTYEYNEGLFKKDTITRLIGQFAGLCRAIVDNPQRALGQYPLLGAAEKQQLRLWSECHRDLPDHLTVNQLIIEQLLGQREQGGGEQTALIFDDHRIGYQALAQVVRVIMQTLLEAGVGPAQQVPVCMPVGPLLIASQLAVLLLGATYVPLDPDYPPERLLMICQSFQAKRIILAGDHDFSSLTAPFERVELAPFDVLSGLNSTVSLSDYKGGQWQSRDFQRQDAVVIFTSGTTGKPKGVRLSHRNIVNLVLSFVDSYQVSTQDTILPITSIASASFIGEVLPLLACGGTVVLADKTRSLDLDNLRHDIQQYQVSILSTVPSMVARLNQSPALVDSLRLLLCGGEALLPHQIDRLINRPANKVTVVNGYGLTESGVCSTYHVVKPQTEYGRNQIPIGKPIINTRIYVLDEYLQQVPVGVRGELYIAGDGICNGYLNDEEENITQSCFVYHPENPQERMLKTGDKVRWLDCGELEYIERNDRQVQIKGFRVELAEIESCLGQHPDITDVYVKTQPLHFDKDQDEQVLVAYYTSVCDVPVASDPVRVWLSARLPAHMLPLFFEHLSELPLNVNGKVDGQLLAEIDLDARLQLNDIVAAKTETEQRLIEVWQHALGLSAVSVTANFFDIGGHSLLLTTVQQVLRSRHQIDISLMNMFTYTSIRKLAGFIDTPDSRELALAARIESQHQYESQARQQRAAFGSPMWRR